MKSLQDNRRENTRHVAPFHLKGALATTRLRLRAPCPFISAHTRRAVAASRRGQSLPSSSIEKFQFKQKLQRQASPTEYRIGKRNSGIEDRIEKRIDILTKENIKYHKLLAQIQEIWDTITRPNLKIIGIEEGEESQLKGPENIFNKIIEENFPNLKEEMVINVQEAYRTPN